MERDMLTFQKWHDWHLNLSLIEFERQKQALLKTGIKEEIQKANKMIFQFEKKFLLNYGNCSKLNKQVSFIPNICQLETQSCFLHRKDLI